MSSTVPSASPTETRSPSRMGWLIAIITPATKFARVERAAKPTTNPSTADDARTVCAADRVASNDHSTTIAPRKTIRASAVRRSSR